jgi:hypothetical protein
MFDENRFENLPEIFKGESKILMEHFAKYFSNNEKFTTWLGEQNCN